MKKYKVFFCGGEGQNWALDHDLARMRKCTASFVEETSLEEAEIVHSVWWRALLEIPPEKLQNKKVIACIADDPTIVWGNEDYLAANEIIDFWLAEYQESVRFLTQSGIPNIYHPSIVDNKLFKAPVNRKESQKELKKKCGISDHSYLIGNFHKDSSLGDLNRPKKQKGADLLLEIAIASKREGIPIHFLLAGPRRHWIRKEFKRNEIPFTYLGEETEADDVRLNTITLDQVAEIIQGIDLYLIPSRWEGAPNSALECAASKTKVLSTRVGQAGDIFPEEALFKEVGEAVSKIKRDYEYDYLSESLDFSYQKILINHTYESVATRVKNFYQLLRASVPKKKNPLNFLRIFEAKRYQKTAYSRYLTLRERKRSLKISLWHEFRPPPYGGGNQFMIALEEGLKKIGCEVFRNVEDEKMDAHILHGHHFDRDLFQKVVRRKKQVVIHRVDGPIHRYRGRDQEVDDLVFDLNQKFADASVFQSAWSLEQTVDAGYIPIRPILARNAPNPEIFSKKTNMTHSGKIRLISTSWSNNVRKGANLYKFLDENLDWNRFEYTFVGRVSSEFKNIQVMDPQSSEELSETLKNHDIYITASQNDPCSNALGEALACGLPALYLQSGGHPELVGFGGVSFSGENNVLEKLDEMEKNMEAYKKLVWPYTLEEVSRTYLNTILMVREIKRI